MNKIIGILTLSLCMVFAFPQNAERIVFVNAQNANTTPANGDLQKLAAERAARAEQNARPHATTAYPATVNRPKTVANNAVTPAKSATTTASNTTHHTEVTKTPVAST